jgi:Na+/H+ antiporter NhaD/arsenite permease-like protein
MIKENGFLEIIPLVSFVLAYVLFVIQPHRRTWVAVIFSAGLLFCGAMAVPQAFWAIDWNIMGIFVGTLALANSFMDSRVPAYLAELIINRSRNTAWAILFICMMAAGISAFMENVATVLIIAPIALSLAKKIKINPTYMLIAIAIASNLEGAATLIGDPPSMLLASFAGLNFMDFFWYHGRPGIFFAVQLGALTSFAVLYWFFCRHTEKTAPAQVEKIVSLVPTALLCGMVAALIGSSFIKEGFQYAGGAICMLFGVAALVWDKFSIKKSIRKNIRGLDWETTFFLMGIFILVGGLTMAGWIDQLAVLLAGIIGQNVFFGYTLLVLFSILVSAFVDNVPFLATMLPVAMAMSQKLGVDPTVFLFGLLIGASLGGNITPIGASANIVACGALKREGYPVTFGKFAVLAVPFTIAAVVPAYLFIWFLWGR